ncbi:MAG: hypothetical protein E7544_01885 [Ruminococcaceae bacterium]|nr:hypothetical protein [Oscillospiraceae bacterium]
MKNKTANYAKATDSVMKFLATEGHIDVVTHLDESEYICDLYVGRNSFLQSIVVDEVKKKVVMKLFWGFNVEEEHKNELIECLERIKNVQCFPLYSVEFDSTGRLYSTACENYDMHEVTLATLKCMEEICVEAYENFASEVASVNAGNSIDEDFFDSIVDASYFCDFEDEEEDDDSDNDSELTAYKLLEFFEPDDE